MMYGLQRRAIDLVVRTHLKDRLRPVYHFLQDWSDRGVLRRNAVLKDTYRGHRCFILATGASLNELDLGLLAGERVFGCNWLHIHKQLRGFPFTAYAETEPLWAFKSHEMAATYFGAIASGCADPDTVFFFSATVRRVLRRHGLFANRRVHYLKPSLPIGRAKTLSNDLTRRNTFMNGVIFCMIGAAIYMGFREIYLGGCGYTYRPCQSGHFYEDWTLLQDQPNDPAHYLRHELTRRFAESQGVKIYNIVPAGFDSPVYKKTSWQAVAENVLRSSLTPASRESAAT